MSKEQSTNLSERLESLKKSAENAENPNEVFSAVNSIANQLLEVETFIARRFDELSMEINATSQQVDMAEEGIARRFSEILEILHAVSFSGDGNSPANAGVELDAVVEMTEKAATRILDAADRIANKVHGKFQTDNTTDLEDIDKDIEEIFLACSFQDITGQRIRQTLKNLQTIEERLGTTLKKIGISVEPGKSDTPALEVAKATSQQDIDALFSEKRSETE